MADGITIRSAFEAVLFKIEGTEGTDASPTGSADAIPFEAGSFTWSDPFTQLQANEASGSLVSGAPLVVGQAVTLSFRFRIKGPNQTPTAVIFPPHHPVYLACGWRGQFQAAIASAVATAGTTTSATLAVGFAATAQLFRGMMLQCTAGPNVGEFPLITDYTAGRLATFADLFPTAMTASSSLGLPANWTYANTSPASAAARTTDQPSATVYRYVDGKLIRFVGVRGQLDFDKPAGASPGFATFNGTGIYLGESDAAIPAQPNLLTHAAPLILQGAQPSEAFLINRRALPISTFTFNSGAVLESPEDPNSASGFGAAVIGGRTPVFSCDPLQTLVATRDTLSDIAAGSVYSGAIRGGYTAGNRWALTFPRMQPVARGDADRGALKSEALQLRVLNTAVQDPGLRDNDAILTFA